MTKKQSNLLSFFGGGTPAASASKPAVKQGEQKENAENTLKKKKDAMEEEDKEGEEETIPSPAKRKSPPSGEVKSKRRRQVIEDDSSDEEDDSSAPSKASSDADTDKIIKPSGDEKKADMQAEGKKDAKTNKPLSRNTEKAVPKSAAKRNNASSSSSSNLSVGKPASKTSLKSEESNSSSSAPSKSKASTDVIKAAAKGQFKSDKTLLDQIPESWKSSERIPYAVLCQKFSEIEAISSRLQIQEILTTLLRKVILKSPQDIYAILYLASNSVAPACQNVELGIGDSLLVKAIGEATGTNANMVREKYESIGDLGSVAQSFKSKQKTLGGFFTVAATTGPNKNSLTADQVLTVFREIAETKGNQSQKWKVDKIKRLLVRATEAAETKYIIRGLQGKLRIGLAQSTVLISLAHALALTEPSTRSDEVLKRTKGGDDQDEDEYPEEAKQFVDHSQSVEKRLEAAVAIIKKAYSEVPSFDALLDAALKVPLQELHKFCNLSPGIPVEPMLAKPTKSIQEVLKRLNGQRFTCEYKYDGERAQVHMLPDGTTKVFSRNLLDTSEKYPEVPKFVKEACKEKNVTSFILDTEVVAYNNKTQQLVPFQILSTRKKTEESAESAKVQVIVEGFDLMYLNGKSLLRKTLAERRALLHEHFQAVPGKFQFATALDHVENGDTTVIEEFLDNAVKGQCEGLMVKTLDANAMYEPSRRSLNWLKLKKDYLEGLGDSVDLVPLGAYYGKGKRTGVYGAYLLACYDPDTEEFQSVCKIGTGFSDEDLKNLAASFKEHIVPAKTSQYNVTEQLSCDVWFDAVQVWEVKAADLSKSSAHRGAVGKTGEAGRGIGLRFPRFERVRDDKRPEEATTSDQILEMYYNQDAIVSGEDAMDDDDGI